jgi:dedicated sortase system histidine kinase
MPPSNQQRFYHSIRFKLLLVALTLLAIPWAGYRYIQETEAFLRQGQEQILLGTAQAIATVLHNQDELSQALGEASEPYNREHALYVLPLHSHIQLDGYTEDWAPYLRNIRHYGSEHLLSFNGEDNKPSLSFDLLLGQRGQHLYALLQVKDDRIIYRPPGSNRLDQNDHLSVLIQQPDGSLARYQLATSAPGWINGYLMPEQSDSPYPERAESRIKGEWQETAEGYNIEMRIPHSLVGERMAFAIADVDDAGTRQIQGIISTAGIAQPGMLITPSPAIARILDGIEHENARIWVLDRHQRVLAQKGSLEGAAVEHPSDTPAFLKALFRLVLQQPTKDFEDEHSGASRLTGPEIEAALAGKPGSRRRATPDEEAIILSAAWPIRSTHGTAGVVLVEQSTNAILSLQNEALERLFTITLTFFAATSLVLLGFASLLTGRIRRLRNRVEAAVTPDGRILGEVKAGRSQDEIGDLGRSFSGVLNRLSEYNRYLEAMASRLAHELRTPLTVVKSSLENLDMNPPPEDQQRYLKRAMEGTERLGLILHRMREATRLEQLLQQTEAEPFDLSELVRVAAESYRTAYPTITFEAEAPEGPFILQGAPDLISQALDKLINNAVDFHTSGTPIRIGLKQTNLRYLQLTVTNDGPPLPEGLSRELFESMVSVRSDESGEPHLGLGLYLVRLICEFHHGRVKAKNLANGKGVSFSMQLPL